MSLSRRRNARGKCCRNLLADFFCQGRNIVASLPRSRDLHQLRLTVKRFRYTLELFRPCYGNGLEQRLEALKRMQDHLGAMNDCGRRRRWSSQPCRRRRGSAEFLEFLQKRGDEERSNFLRHWQETFDAPGQEAWWVEYLTRPETIGSGRAREQSEAESDHTLSRKPPAARFRFATGPHSVTSPQAEALYEFFATARATSLRNVLASRLHGLCTPLFPLYSNQEWIPWLLLPARYRLKR